MRTLPSRLLVLALLLAAAPPTLAAAQSTEVPPPPVQGPPPAPVQAGSFPGSFQVPGTRTSFRFGGYFKLDAIHDFGAIDNRDAFVTSGIPVPEVDSDGNTSIHARDTRLHMETRTTTDFGDVRGYVEGNFFGAGNTFALRHAFLETDRLLAGQTWTNFMLIESRPETLDFEGPDGSVFLRLGQARWTQPVAEHVRWTVALEDPRSDLVAPVGSAPEQVYPDLTSGLRLDDDWGHLYASGFVREIAYAGAASDSVVGWGGNLSGRLESWGRDNFRFQVAYGYGMARYIEDLRGLGLDAGPDASGDLEALPTFAGFLSYQRHWSDAWRSTAVYSVASVDNSDGQAGDTLKRTSYTSLNLIWRAAAALDIGAEFLHGTRENKDGADAAVDRQMFSVVYRL